MMVELILQVALAALILLVLASQARSSLRRWEPTAWARDMGLKLAPSNERFVRAYVARTRIFRTVGCVAGLVAPLAYQAMAGGGLPKPFDFSLFDVLAGYLVGAVLAEVTFRRPRPDVPAASLVPRDLDAYLPHALTTGLRVSAAAALALIPPYLLASAHQGRTGALNVLPGAVLAPMIVILAVGVELLARHIVLRPQPAADTDLLRADDAVRSSSVHALAGAGIALELIFIAVELVTMGAASATSLLRWTLPWIGFACFLAALATWAGVSRPEHWRVRRGFQAARP